MEYTYTHKKEWKRMHIIGYITDDRTRPDWQSSTSTVLTCFYMPSGWLTLIADQFERGEAVGYYCLESLANGHLETEEPLVSNDAYLQDHSLFGCFVQVVKISSLQ